MQVTERICHPRPFSHRQPMPAFHIDPASPASVPVRIQFYRVQKGPLGPANSFLVYQIVISEVIGKWTPTLRMNGPVSPKASIRPIDVSAHQWYPCRHPALESGSATRWTPHLHRCLYRTAFPVTRLASVIMKLDPQLHSHGNLNVATLQVYQFWCFFHFTAWS